MTSLNGYHVQKTLRSSSRSQVYLATRESDGVDVFVKRYPGDTQDVSGSRAARELLAIRAAAGPGVPEGFAVVPGPDTPLLVLEWIPGVSLCQWVESSRPTVKAFLTVAIQLTETLARVHSARLIHRDLTPYNVMVDPASLKATIVDFGVAQSLGAQERSFDASAGPGVGGALQYISPEQTGRMNRGIDMRSDLYSLGATLYYALTRRAPFEGSDTLALLHALLARTPRAPFDLRPDVPLALSRIVLRLLEKEPDDRYQSARALHADLVTCQDQLAQRGAIDEMLVLGTAEAPDRPRFSRRIHGRDAEIARLRELYARAAGGATQVLMLAGEPGAGRSALVDQLRPPLAETGGYLAPGKFDVSQERPYSAWAAALGAFVQQLLVESDERLLHWRDVLGTALGNIARVMVDLVPNLGFVLGEVPPVPELGPRETQARLALALKRFISACATPDHPLVLFLDDMQWSDAASRALLDELLADASSKALLVIGAYRASEVQQGHPLASQFARLRERGISVEFMSLGPLSIDASTALLAEALERTPEAVRPLAVLIHRKTGNAPLFVRQFVEHMQGRGLLVYAHGSGWTWEPAAVAAADIPEGAVALLTSKLHRLEPGPRAILELASCIGDEFVADLLCELSQTERGEVEKGLWTLCDEGLIAPCPGGFRFSHDRIREATSALLSQDARARLHHETCQLLLARLSESERSARIFEIAEHLSQGLRYMSEEQRLPGLRILLAAGKRALAAGAALTAEAYLEVARRLLRDEDWKSEHALAFDLSLQSVESAFLRRDFDSALQIADLAEAHAVSPVQIAQVSAKRILVYALTRSPEECATHALAVLARFGLRLPLRPSRLRAYFTMRLVLWRMQSQGIDAVTRPATAMDPQRIAKVILVGAAGGVLSRVSTRLVALVSSWMVTQNLKHGCLARPGFTLGTFSAYLQIVLGATAEAERIETAALDGERRSPDPVYAPRTEMIMRAVSHPWRMPRRRALAPLDRVGNALQELGDLEYCYYSRFLKSAFGALAGEPVASAAGALQGQVERVRRSGHRYSEPQFCLRAVLLLQAAPDAAIPIESEIAASEVELAAEHSSAEPYVRTLWMMVLCIYRRWDLVLAQSDAIGTKLFEQVAFVHIADHTLYRGLAAAALAPHGRGLLPDRGRRSLRESLRRMRSWARSGPDFAHMVLLLQAEEARLAHNFRRARALYEEAAQCARHADFPHHVALAHERRGDLLLA
jgi:histidine kinase